MRLTENTNDQFTQQSLFSSNVSHARQWSKVHSYNINENTATMNCGFAVHRGMTDIRQVTAYTVPHVRASLTRKDKYPRLTIYLNSRCTRLSFESSDICRLLAPSRSLLILSSSLLHSIRCTHLISHRIALSFSFSLLHFLSPSLSLSLSRLSSVAVRETVRIHGRSARYSMRCTIAYDVDCQNLGEVPGEVVYR